MPGNSSIVARDRFALTRNQLLEDYAKISSKRRSAAEFCALRLPSRQYLEILAFEASGGEIPWEDLYRRLVSNELNDELGQKVDLIIIAEIARVLLLHPIEEHDECAALHALRWACKNLPASHKTRRFRILLVQKLLLDGCWNEADGLISTWPDIAKEFFGYLRAEISKPKKFRSGSPASEAWLRSFNEPFRFYGLSEVQLQEHFEDDWAEFDRLTVRNEKPCGDVEVKGRHFEATQTPLVSIVISSFEPSLNELNVAVNSLLNQTLQDFELIIVDDGSGPEFDHVFDCVSNLDERIRVVRMEDNRGTYSARNVGFSQARGKYVTGQDDDDWSHPARLFEQVSILESDDTLAGCRTYAVTCLEDLSRLRLGYKPFMSNASTLMVKKADFDLVGGFLPIRKAADTELAKRMEQVTGKRITDIAKPLTIIRILSHSLSRGEFRAGWSHPARREFKSAYAYWHAKSTAQELKLGHEALPEVFVPRRFRVADGDATSCFDVVLAGDWRQYGGPQKSMIEEIHALVSAGYKVGVMQLEAPRFMSAKVKPLTGHIQRLINQGVVEELMYDDRVNVSLFILRYPPILQFAIDMPSSLSIEKMYILANQAPSERDGSDIRYLVPDCHENAKTMFCGDVTWVPQGPQVREAIAPYLRKEDIAEFDCPGVVDPSEWNLRLPGRRRGVVPVVGRHSRDNVMKWPGDKRTLEMVYPLDGRLDVRILGGATKALAVLGETRNPPAWTVWGTDAMPVSVFLRSLDFYVFYQNENATEAFGRAILEAIASNVVVILPPHYEEVFGKAAVYCAPEQVESTIKQYHQDDDLYQSQLLRAQEVLESRFTHASYLRLLSPVIGPADSNEG